MNIKRPIPTEEYPKLMWWQEKREKYTPEEREVEFNRYLKIFLGYSLNSVPGRYDPEDIKVATEKANRKVDENDKIITVLKKEVVEDKKDHLIRIQEIENNKNFIQWYIK